MVTRQSQFMLRLHGHYKNKILPFAGGLLDQPQYYIEAMEVLSARSNELAEEELEKLQRRQGTHGH